jgi:hypothetical protein
MGRGHRSGSNGRFGSSWAGWSPDVRLEPRSVFGRCPRHVRFAPDSNRIVDIAERRRRKATSAAKQKMPLFDHFIGKGEQIVGYLDAERLNRLHIDDAEKFGFLHDREVCRFSAFKH